LTTAALSYKMSKDDMRRRIPCVPHLLENLREYWSITYSRTQQQYNCKHSSQIRWLSIRSIETASQQNREPQISAYLSGISS